MKLVTLVLAALIGLVVASPAPAQFPYPDGNDLRLRDRYAAPDSRHVWVYRTTTVVGRFEEIGQGRWVEINNTGQFFFIEVARTPDFIELYDPSRGGYARLYDDRMLTRAEGSGRWIIGYWGHWR